MRSVKVLRYDKAWVYLYGVKEINAIVLQV